MDLIVGVDFGEGYGYTSVDGVVRMPNNTNEIIKEFRDFRLETYTMTRSV